MGDVLPESPFTGEVSASAPLKGGAFDFAIVGRRGEVRARVKEDDI